MKVENLEVDPNPELNPARPARDPEARREVPDLRTESSRTYENNDGTFTTEQFTEPVNVERGDHLDPINTSLDPGSDGKLRPAETKVEQELNDSGKGELAVVKPTSDTRIGFSLRGAADVVGHVDGDKVTYGQLLPGVDLELESSSTAVKETVFLTGSGSPSTLIYDLQLEGLSASIGHDGSVDFTDSTGNLVAMLPVGFAVDNAGALTHSITYQLDGAELRMSVDVAWLADPARVFPVRIDPTVGTTEGSSASVPLVSCNPSTNYLGQNLWVGLSPTGCQTASVVKFDLSSIPARSRILSAQVQLDNFYSHISCVPKPVYLHRVTSSWDPATVSWNSVAFWGSPVASSTFAYGCGGGEGNHGWESFDMTYTMQQWVDGTWANQGLLMRAVPGSGNETDPIAYKEFSPAMTDRAPKLVFDWSPYRASYAGTDGFVVNPTRISQGKYRLTVTNGGAYTWDTASYKLTYFLYSTSDEQMSSQSLQTPLPSAVAPGQSATIDVDIETLNPGWYYLKFTVEKTSAPSVLFTWEGSPPWVILTKVPDLAPVITNVGPAGTIPTVTPTINAYAYDPDSWPNDSLTYDFKMCEDTALTLNCRSATGLTEGAWLPAGWSTLHWAKTYFWYVTVRHGSTATSSPLIALTASPPQPSAPAHLGVDPTAAVHGGVNTGNGNYTQSFTDLKAEVAGPALSLDRTYNSLDARTDTLYGRGFSTAFDMEFMSEPATHTALVTFADGHQERFGLNPDWSGIYSAPMYRREVLEHQNPFWGVSQEVLTMPNGARYTFDSATANPTYGKLIEVRDQNDHYLSLQYTAGGRLDYIRATPSGRMLHFGWTQSAPYHVSSLSTDLVIAHGGPLSVSYTYSGDNLSSVCGPRMPSECHSYAWGTDAANVGSFNRITKITTPGSNDPSSANAIPNTAATSLDYRPDGTVMTRKDGAAQAWTYGDDRDRQGGLYHPVAPVRIYSSVTATWGSNAQMDFGVTAVAGFPTEASDLW